MRWIDGLQERAEAILPAPVGEYVRQGATRSISAGEADQAWDHVRFRPRVLRDVSGVRCDTTVLGHEVASPVLIAPSTLQRLATPDGELATGRAARAAGTLMTVSSNAGTTFEEIGALGHPWWLQAYVVRDRGLTTAMVQRAAAAGATAVVLTVDTPVVGTKYQAGPSVWDLVTPDLLRVNLDAFGLPDSALDKADDLTPDTIGWLADATGLPVLVKGVLRGDDAFAAVEAGAAGIIVSNHGGRQLDLAVATARALPEVVQAVGGRTEVLVDGGVRRGEHVLAALALGARAVLVGRPVLWALAVDGEAGVVRLLDDLREEVLTCLTLAGAASPAEVGVDLIAW